MEEDYRKSLKCMVFAQSFVEALDDMEGSNHFKQQMKNKGKAFCKEVDVFLNSVYKNGGADSSMTLIIEECQKAIDKVIEEDVFVSKSNKTSNETNRKEKPLNTI